MLEKLKSAAVVVIITFMIWFAADQNVKEERSYPVTVRIVSETADRYAAIVEIPHQITFNVTLDARRRRLQEFSDLVNGKPVFEAVVTRDEEPSSKPRVMSARDVLNLVKEIDDFGIGYISRVDPAGVTVLIDDYRTVNDVRVEPIYGELKVTATPEPTKVSVRLPGFLAEKLRQEPVATADAEQRIRAASRPDGTFNVAVPLTLPILKSLPPDAGIKILPVSEVVIAGRIEALTTTKRKGPIQITWSIPDQVQRDYRIVAELDSNFRPDIDVSGPKDQIDQLDPREIRAFVDVFAADAEKPGQTIRRQVQFVLPPGFSLSPGPPYELVFHLEALGDEQKSDETE